MTIYRRKKVPKKTRRASLVFMDRDITLLIKPIDLNQYHNILGGNGEVITKYISEHIIEHNAHSSGVKSQMKYFSINTIRIREVRGGVEKIIEIPKEIERTSIEFLKKSIAERTIYLTDYERRAKYEIEELKKQLDECISIKEAVKLKNELKEAKEEIKGLESCIDEFLKLKNEGRIEEEVNRVKARALDFLMDGKDRRYNIEVLFKSEDGSECMDSIPEALAYKAKGKEAVVFNEKNKLLHYKNIIYLIVNGRKYE